MTMSIPDFWKLVLSSQLFTREQCQHLATQFGKHNAAATDARVLAQWMVSQNVLSRYQATVLLAGRPGPFSYGDYRIYDRLETGRLTGWFRAVHKATNHPVMLKFLAATQSPAHWQFWTSGLRLTANPNLVRFYDAVDLGSYKFFVVEDLRGQSLAERLQAGGALPADEACRLIQLVATGMAALHQLGRPHGDARPANIWLDATGSAKLLYEADLQSGEPPIRQSAGAGDMLAKADYLAPEFLQPGKTPDFLSDIYSLGCSLYESIAGKPPFAGGTLQEKMQRHATEAIRPLDALGAPQPVSQAVAYMMAKNPAVRFQQAAQVAHHLEQFVGAARANLRPASVPATQQAYETWLQSKPAAAPVAAVPIVAARANPVAQPSASVANAVPAPVVTNLSRPAVTTTRRRGSTTARGKKQFALLGISLGVVILLLTVGIWVVANSGSTPAPPGPPEVAQTDPTPETETPVEPSVDDSVSNAATAKEDVGPAIVEDDGQLLWASPTSGSPIELKYIPSGARVLLIVRPANMLAQSTGEQVLPALGPDFTAALNQWETAAGVKLADIERLVLALYPNDGQFPKVCSTVQLRNPTTQDALLAAWGNPAAVADLPAVYQRADTAYYIPSDGEDRVFVMGPLETEIRTLVTEPGVPLQRDLARLLGVSDDKRHVTLLFQRQFFFVDGKEMFTGERAKALTAMDWVFGDGVKAGMIGFQFGEPFYFEFRAENDLSVDPPALVTALQGRIDEIPNQIVEYLVTLNPPPYWRHIAQRYDSMVEDFCENTRSGVEGDHAVLNSVLPGIAAHNLAFGGEMLLALAPGAGGSAVAAAQPSGPKTIDEVLQTKMSISFAQDALDFAMGNIQAEVKSSYKNLPFEFKILIMGDDLKVDGITKNQSIRDFNLQDATVADILTAMVRKANPVTTVKDPSEKDQKLLWVVAPDPANASNRIVLITTRQAADNAKYTLPELFRLK